MEQWKKNWNKHKASKNLSWLAMIISMFLPYIIIMIVNHETYFTEKNKISLSIGCVFCIIVAFIMVKKANILKGIGGFIAVALISWLMTPVMQDLTMIAFWGGVGYAISLFFKSRYEAEKQWCKAYINREVSEQ